MDLEPLDLDLGLDSDLEESVLAEQGTNKTEGTKAKENDEILSENSKKIELVCSSLIESLKTTVKTFQGLSASTSRAIGRTTSQEKRKVPWGDSPSGSVPTKKRKINQKAKDGKEDGERSDSEVSEDEHELDPWDDLSSSSSNDNGDDEGDDQLGPLRDLFGELKDACGPDISTKLADAINLALSRDTDEDKVKALCEKIKRPKNCPNICVPRTNEMIWKSRSLGQKSRDIKLQRTQGLVVKSLSTVATLMDNVQKLKRKREVDLNLLEEQAKTALKLSVATFSELNMRRLESLYKGPKEDYASLFKKAFASNPQTKSSTEFLFGSNLQDKIKELEEENRTFHRLGKGKAGAVRPFRSGNKMSQAQSSRNQNQRYQYKQKTYQQWRPMHKKSHNWQGQKQQWQ